MTYELRGKWMYQQIQKCLTDILMHPQKTPRHIGCTDAPQVPMTYGEYTVYREHTDVKIIWRGMGAYGCPMLTNPPHA